MSEEEEEVLMEVEAVEAIYGEDCIVLNKFPPHLRLHLKPRTADVDSQQYPSDPPCIAITGSKGLDEKRQKLLSTRLHDKARELESCSMIVSLCEEAVEALSSMNHPEGDCPLCLYPLLAEDALSKSQPFMKLMSCFHCFHCECIIRWLKWFLSQNGANCKSSSALSPPFDYEVSQDSDLREMMGDSAGNCPVCRKVFLAKDIEHVLNSVDSDDLHRDVDEKERDKEFLKCPLETSRRQKFEAILELQKQHGGLIEPPKDNILFSRLSLHELVSEPAVETNGEVSEQQQTDQSIIEEEPNGSSSQTRQRAKRRPRGHRTHTGNAEPASSGSEARPSTSQHQHSGARRHGKNNSKAQPKQWTRKE